MARRKGEDIEEQFESEITEENTDELEEALDNDEISPEEEGFSRGCKDAEDGY